MELNKNGTRPGASVPGAEQLYRMILRLIGSVEEIRTAVFAIRRQLDAEAAERRASGGGGGA